MSEATSETLCRVLFGLTPFDDIPMAIPPMSTDVEIVALARRGHQDAIALLVKKYSPRLHRYLNHWLGNRPLAEDVLQETWLRVMERLDRYDANHAFRSWLFAVARNCAIDMLRHRSREILFGDQKEDIDRDFADPAATLEDPSPSALQLLETQELQERAIRLFSFLPPLYREALSLRFQEEMPFEEMAAVLKLPRSTVKTRVRRGLELLRRRLGPRGGESTCPDMK